MQMKNLKTNVNEKKNIFDNKFKQLLNNYYISNVHGTQPIQIFLEKVYMLFSNNLYNMLINTENPNLSSIIDYLNKNNYFGYKDKIIQLIDQFETVVNEINEKKKTTTSTANFNNINNYNNAISNKVTKSFTLEQKDKLKNALFKTNKNS